MRLEDWTNVRRIVAIRPDNIGDVVMLSAALREMKRTLPRARITLLTSPAGSQVGPLLPWINDVIALRPVWQDASNAMPLNCEREMELIRSLHNKAYDAAVIFTSFSQSPYPPAYIAYLAGIPIRIGQSKEFGGSVLSHCVRSVPDWVHQAERNLHLLEASGIRPVERNLELHVPAAAVEAAYSILRAHGVEEYQYMVLAPGASCAARRYDTARYAEVARQWIERTGVPIVIVGNEKESASFQPILNAAGNNVLSLAGKISIPQLCAVIERAQLLIGNDSGPMHIADAFQRPMVILYSGTEYASQWKPRNSPAVLLRRPTPCSPCYAFHCYYQMECLDILPEEVVAEAIKLRASERAVLPIPFNPEPIERSPMHEPGKKECVPCVY